MKTIMSALTLIILLGLMFTIPEPLGEAQVDTEITQVKEDIKLQNEPVEIVSRRTVNSKTYDNGDGSYKAVIYLKPIHYKDANSNWQEVDENEPNHGSRSRNVESLSASKDSMISTSFGGSANEELNLGADPDLILTHDTSSATSYFPFRIVAKFDIESLSIPSSTQINSAKFNLYYYQSEGIGGDPGIATQLSISAYPLTRDWVEGTGLWSSGTNDGVCWNFYDGTNSWSNTGGDYSTSYSGSGSTPTSYGWTQIGIKDMVEAWVAGSITNHGVILIGEHNHDFLKKFRSSDFGTSSQRPKLEIDYVSNRAPIINIPYPKLELKEDQPAKYLDLDGNNRPTTGLFKELDPGDTLKYYVWTGTSWAGVSMGKYESELMTVTVKNNGTLEVGLENNSFGNEKITVKAKDGDAAELEYEINIIVEPVNDPPKINDTTNWEYEEPYPIVCPGYISCFEDQWVNFTITAWDPVEREDDSKLTYTSNKTEEYASFFNIDFFNGTVSFKPENSDVGLYYLSITVSDENDTTDMLLLLEIENVNDIPRFKQIKIGNIYKNIPIDVTEITLIEPALEDIQFQFEVNVEDVDLDLPQTEEELMFVISPSKKFSIVNLASAPKVAYIYFNPENEDVGVFTAQLSVFDRYNAQSTITLNINVANTNDPPEFNRFMYKNSQSMIDSDILDLRKHDQSFFATEYEPYIFQIEANDFDPMDELQFEVEIEDRSEAESNEICFINDIFNEPNIKEITVTPDTKAGREEKLWLNVTAIDLNGERAWVRIRIPVINKNEPPEKPNVRIQIIDADKRSSKLENLTATLSAYYTADVTDIDPDGNSESELIYSWDFGDDSHQKEGKEVQHTFPEEGKYSITLTVSDPEGASTITIKEIEVFEPPRSSNGEESDDDEGSVLGMGSIAGFPIVFFLFFIIILIIIVIIILSLFLRNKKKKYAEQQIMYGSVSIKPHMLSEPTPSPYGQITQIPISAPVPPTTYTPMSPGPQYIGMQWVAPVNQPIPQPVQQPAPAYAPVPTQQTQPITIQTHQIPIPGQLPLLPPGKPQQQAQTETEPQSEQIKTELDTSKTAPSPTAPIPTSTAPTPNPTSTAPTPNTKPNIPNQDQIESQ